MQVCTVAGWCPEIALRHRQMAEGVWTMVKKDIIK